MERLSLETRLLWLAPEESRKLVHLERAPPPVLAENVVCPAGAKYWGAGEARSATTGASQKRHDIEEAESKISFVPMVVFVRDLSVRTTAKAPALSK